MSVRWRKGRSRAECARVEGRESKVEGKAAGTDEGRTARVESKTGSSNARARELREDTKRVCQINAANH